MFKVVHDEDGGEEPQEIGEEATVEIHPPAFLHTGVT